MKQLILVALCLLAASKIFAQDTIVTMTTTLDYISIYVEWTGSGVITSNGRQLNNSYSRDRVSVLFGSSGSSPIYPVDGSVVLVANGDAQLKVLRCNMAYLSTLSAANCPELTELSCYDNSLTALNINNCPKLEKLICHENSLTALNVTNYPALKYLSCSNNALTVLDVGNCTELTELFCSHNNLTALDVTKCTALKTLYCQNNTLTALDVSNCPELMYLHSENNPLSGLDVTNCPVLRELYCFNNSLTALDVTKCPGLWRLNCSRNFLSALDVTNCPEIERLYADDQAPTLPAVRVKRSKIRIKTPITFDRTEVNIENISHSGTYAAGRIIWNVSGESGKLTFNFTSELPEETIGEPFSGIATQLWTTNKK